MRIGLNTERDMIKRQIPWDIIEMGQTMNKEQEAARKIKAWDLRVRGFTYRQIAAELGIGHGTAERWCKEVLEAQSTPLADEIRKQEYERLERYLKALDERIDDGDDKAINLAIRASESLRKMMGADMPTQITHNVNETSQVDLEIMDLIASQNAKNAIAKEQASIKKENEDNAS